MTVVDAAAVAEGAVLVKVVQTAIDVVVLGPLTSRWSKAGRAARDLRECRKNLEDRRDAMANAVINFLDDDLLAEAGQPSARATEELRELMEQPAFANLARQAVTIALGQPDVDLIATLTGPSSVVVHALAPTAFAEIRGIGRRIAELIATEVGESIKALGLPDEALTDRDTIRALTVATASQLAAIAYLIEVSIQPGTDVNRWYSFAATYRAGLALTHSKLPTPHWDGEPRVDSDTIYIDPTFRTSGDREVSPLHSTEQYEQRVVLLGDPGNGKTTYSSRLVLQLALERMTWAGTPRTPFVVTLRSYLRRSAEAAAGLTFIEFLAMDIAENYQVRPGAGAIEFMLLNGYGFVVFDGLDEILNVTRRREIVQAIEVFASQYPSSPILVTSRDNGYEHAPLSSDVFHRIHLSPFTSGDVTGYLERWFRLDADVPPARRRRNRKTMEDNLAHLDPKLYTNPLTLALLCNLFKSGGYQDLPRSRTEIYEKCSLTLYDRWDRRRGVGSREFERDFLPPIAHLATLITEDPRFAGGLTEQQMEQQVTAYCYPKKFTEEDEARRFARDLVEHCVGRAWVFSSEANDRNGDALFGFTHRTFQEYFAALSLVRRNAGGSDLARASFEWLLTDERSVICEMAFELKVRQLEDAAADYIETLLEMAAAGPPSAQRQVLVRLVGMARWTPIPHRYLVQILDASWQEEDASWLLETALKWYGENGRVASRHLLRKLEAALPTDAELSDPVRQLARSLCASAEGSDSEAEWRLFRRQHNLQ